MRYWNEDHWAALPNRGLDLAAKLKAAGYTVLRVINGKPHLQEEISDMQLHSIVQKLLRNEAPPARSPIVSKPQKKTRK